MFTFLHAADLHLDSPLRGLGQYDGAPVDQIRQASRRALENLVRTALDRRVAFVVLAGDIYDGDWRDHNTGLFFKSALLPLRDAGIPVFLIAGNHDAASRMTRHVALSDHVRVLDHARAETVMLDEFDVAIHGQGFAKPAVLENLAAAYPAAVRGCFNLGLLHTCATGSDRHERYAPCSLTDLAAREYDYWALGHIHDRRELHREGETPIWFAGNLQGRHIRESGAKGCLCVTVDGGRASAVDFVPLDVLRWETIELRATEAERVEDMLEAFDESLAAVWERHDRMPLAVRVIVSGRSRVHQALAQRCEHFDAQLKAAALDLSDGRVWIEQTKLRTQPHQPPDADGPLGELTEYLAELRDDPASLARLAEELRGFVGKLPEEVRTLEDALLGDDPDAVAALLAEVEPLLVGRLMAQEVAG